VTQNYRNVEIFTYKAKCKYPNIQPSFQTPSDKKVVSYILGGCTIDPMKDNATYSLAKESNCFALFAPQTLIDDYISQGAYLMTPGWLKKWEYYVQEQWGFDEQSAQSFFAEFCKKLILLDTLLEEEYLDNLRDFAHFVGCDYERVPVGLEYFRLYIRRIIDRIHIQELEHNRQKYKMALQEKSNYAMAIDLLSRLNERLNEVEIIERITEIFTMLFAPQHITYLAIEKNNVIKELSSKIEANKDIEAFLTIESNYRAYHDDGFCLKFIYDEEVVGFIRIESVAYKEYLTPYLNLALVISDLCALAIANARNSLKTKQMQAKLAQNSKLAAMGEMLSSIAHQWRQPLNTLHLNIEMLEDYYDADQIDEAFIQKFIDKNTTTIQFLSQTISDFSNFFRIHKQKAHFNIKTNILSILNILNAQLQNHNISCTIEGAEYEYFGLGNEFKQVILNLINNAKDAIISSQEPKGQIDITIDKQNSAIIITIEDNGGGIDEAIMGRIFEPYFTTKEEGQGVGLGLYISKMIIEENMAGHLSVSNHNNGAQFKIELMENNEKSR
jgi:signal transduction histidine kinase